MEMEETSIRLGKRGMFMKRNGSSSMLPDPAACILQVLTGDALSGPDDLPLPFCSSQQRYTTGVSSFAVNLLLQQRR